MAVVYILHKKFLFSGTTFSFALQAFHRLMMLAAQQRINHIKPQQTFAFINGGTTS